MKYKLWIARNANGSLFVYEKKPRRCNDLKTWQSGRFCKIPKHLFPDLTFEDEPLEVELRQVITDLDAKAQEYANKVTDNEEIKELIINAYKVGYNS